MPKKKFWSSLIGAAFRMLTMSKASPLGQGGCKSIRPYPGTEGWPFQSQSDSHVVGERVGEVSREPCQVSHECTCVTLRKEFFIFIFLFQCHASHV